MGEVGLAGHRAQRGKLRCREASGIVGIGVRVRHTVEHRLVGALGPFGVLTEDGSLRGFAGRCHGFTCPYRLALTRRAANVACRRGEVVRAGSEWGPRRLSSRARPGASAGRLPCTWPAKAGTSRLTTIPRGRRR